MSGVAIQSAHLGDERARRNITDSLIGRVSGGKLDVLVDSSLIPVVQTAGEIRLSREEEEGARNEAERACGGAGDMSCMEMKTQEFKRQRLKEKENEGQSTANIIKGRRLTVTLSDGRTLEVPEGQHFKLNDIKTTADTKSALPISLPNIQLGKTALELIKALGVVVSVGLYAFSILITYKAFIQTGYTWQTYVATAVAVFFPLSGFFIVLGFFGLREFIKNMPTQ